MQIKGIEEEKKKKKRGSEEQWPESWIFLAGLVAVRGVSLVAASGATQVVVCRLIVVASLVCCRACALGFGAQ